MKTLLGRITQTLFCIFTIGASVFFLSACDPHHDDPSLDLSTAAVTAESLYAYETTLYAFGRRQGCANCHASNVHPYWLNDDMNLAYSSAKRLVRFDNPTASRFAIYAGNNHCNDAACSNPANVEIVQDNLTRWAAEEILQGSTSGGGTSTAGDPLPNPPFVTAAMPIPSNLPLIITRNQAIMRFDLSQVTPPVPALAGAILEVSVQSYNTLNNEYKVFNARVAGNTSSVRITGIHVYVRPIAGTGLGIEDIYQGISWSLTNIAVPPRPLPTPLPTGPMTTIPTIVNTSLGIAAQSAADQLVIGFEVIQ